MSLLYFFFLGEAVGICRYPYHDYIDIGYKYSGTIFSPDYPVPYPDDALCVWRFIVPAGRRLKIKFVDFELRGSSMNDVDDNCNYNMDHVGIDHGSRPVQQNAYCGNQTAFDVYSSGIFDMYVSFLAIPVGVRGKRGFKARFEAVADLPDLTPDTGISTVLVTYLVSLIIS